MERSISFTGQTGIAFVDLDEWIPFMEVDVVVVSRKPGSRSVGVMSLVPNL
jgi:hypothetical protein